MTELARWQQLVKDHGTALTGTHTLSTHPRQLGSLSLLHDYKVVKYQDTAPTGTHSLSTIWLHQALLHDYKYQHTAPTGT